MIRPASVRSFIHHSGALGDVLLSLSCIRAIREASDFIHIACRPDAGRLLECCLLADATSSPDSGLYSSLYTAGVDERCREFLDGFDRAFIFEARDDSLFALTMRRIIPETSSIMTIPPTGSRQHAATFRLLQLPPLAEPGVRTPLLKLPSALTASASDTLCREGYRADGAPLIALHPGSGGKRKCWPLDHYLALAEVLQKRHSSFILMLSGPAEDLLVREELDAFARKHRHTVHMHAGEITTVAALLSLCSLFVGNDSGISHLAGAVNGNALVLFGPTDPEIWKPLGGNVQVISAESLSDISVEEVCETAGHLLSLI